MKKIILITLTMLFGMTVFAQYTDPRGNTPAYNFQLRPNIPGEPLKATVAIPAKPKPENKSIKDVIPDSYFSPTFDPTWETGFRPYLTVLWLQQV